MKQCDFIIGIILRALQYFTIEFFFAESVHGGSGRHLKLAIDRIDPPFIVFGQETFFDMACTKPDLLLVVFIHKHHSGAKCHQVKI